MNRWTRFPGAIALGLSLLLILLLAAPAGAAISVRLDQTAYDVSPGGTFVVRVFIDGDTTLPGDQPVPSGLLAAGIALTFDSTKADLPGLGNLVIPLPLNNDGFGGPPVLVDDPGRLGYVGAVQDVGAPYQANLLATITLQNLAASGSYTVTPTLFYPLADTRTNFGDGQANDIDAQITFSAPSTVIVAVPEPAAIGSIIACIAGVACRRGRRR